MIRGWPSAPSKCSLVASDSARSVHFLHLVLVTSVSLLASEEGLAVLIETEVSDLHVAGVDGELGLLTIRLLSDEFLNVDAPFAAVNFSDFAFAILVRPTDNLDIVSVADGDGARLVLGSQVFAQLGRHHLSTEGGWGSEVCLAGLSSLAGHVCIKETIKS